MKFFKPYLKAHGPLTLEELEVTSLYIYSALVPTSFKEEFFRTLKEMNITDKKERNELIKAFRVILTGMESGQDIWQICNLLGLEEVITRLENTITKTSLIKK